MESIVAIILLAIVVAIFCAVMLMAMSFQRIVRKEIEKDPEGFADRLSKIQEALDNKK